MNLLTRAHIIPDSIRAAGSHLARLVADLQHKTDSVAAEMARIVISYQLALILVASCMVPETSLGAK